jgi:hypothetical protein
MRNPCTISELLAIILSLQNPFFEEIRKIDMKIREPNISDNVSIEYKTFRDSFYLNHELPEMKYLSLSGLLKIAMSDYSNRKPSTLYLPLSQIKISNLEILEHGFILESLSVCTADFEIAKKQLGPEEKGTILEIDA